MPTCIITAINYYKTTLESGSMGEFLASEMGIYGRAKYYLLQDIFL